jgi:hypothetical protein
MKTETEIRKRLEEFKARWDAEVKANSGCLNPADTQRALNLEMLGSWMGALKWTLGEGTEVKG